MVCLVQMQHNTRINGLIKQINEHARRRAFLVGFSQSPAEFINGLIASQVRCTDVLRAAPARCLFLVLLKVRS